jgi:hypothetical protein
MLPHNVQNPAGFAALQIQKQAFIISNLDVFFYSMCGVAALIWIPFMLNKLSKPIDGFPMD